MLIRFPKARRHARASSDAPAAASEGRGTSEGHGPSGQLSENHCIARSSRRTCISAPPSIAVNFLPSSKARELTVVSETPSNAAYARATVSSASMLAIPQISVNLPGKSTAILPDARVVGSGHSTGMDWRPLITLIDKALAAKKLSADRASREAGHPDAIRNMRRKAEGKLKGGITFDTVMDVAKILDLTPESVCRAVMGLQQPTDDRAAMAEQILSDLREAIDNRLAAAPKVRRRRA